MRYLPIHFDTQNAQILVIGGGAAAEAKLRTLIKTEARITLIAPLVSDEIARWVEQGLITHEARSFLDWDIDKATLVYAATEDDQLNAEIAELASEKGKPVNAADQKEACSFITPAIVDRSPVIVSIGTEGTSPSLARAIKSEFETRLPETLGKLALKINQLRGHVKNQLPNLAARQRFWASLFGGTDLDAQLRISEGELANRVATKLRAGEDGNEKGGEVVIVGAGPGSADLLTLGARRALHSADVIVYDRLVSQGVLDFGRREATYIYVGKEPGGKSTPQDEINEILVAKARDGLFVVRLKSGDPLIFGRADEEIAALSGAGITFSIIPGITAAASAAAEIGASLTTRGRNKAVSLLTGHDAKGFADHDWKALSEPQARAAVYMGVGAARFIQGRLLIHGADRNMPVTVVENASRAEQIIVATTLGELPSDIEHGGIKGPAILLLGYAPHESKLALQEMRAAL